MGRYSSLGEKHTKKSPLGLKEGRIHKAAKPDLEWGQAKHTGGPMGVN